MAYRFTRQRVRIAIDVGLKKGNGAIRDVVTGDVTKFGRNAGVQFEVALTYKGALIDISNISAATLEIKQTNFATASNAMSKAIGIASMNTGLTQADWDSGEASKAHFIFTFSSTEAAESVFGTPAAEQEHWLVLWGYTNDDGTDQDSFGVGTVTSFATGVSGAVVAPPAAQNGITLDQLSAMLQGFIKKRADPGDTLTFTNANTGKQVQIGADDNGDFAVSTQTTT